MFCKAQEEAMILYDQQFMNTDVKTQEPLQNPGVS